MDRRRAGGQTIKRTSLNQTEWCALVQGQLDDGNHQDGQDQQRPHNRTRSMNNLNETKQSAKQLRESTIKESESVGMVARVARSVHKSATQQERQLDQSIEQR